MATVIYPNDPARRLKIFWHYPKERRFPMEILIDDEGSQWTAGHGLRLGLNLSQVEALNKRPFKVSGFDTDFFGRAGFHGGALDQVRGGCCARSAVRSLPGEANAGRGRPFVPRSEVTFIGLEGHSDFYPLSETAVAAGQAGLG
jgi:hypothetical protein